MVMIGSSELVFDDGDSLAAKISGQKIEREIPDFCLSLYQFKLKS